MQCLDEPAGGPRRRQHEAAARVVGRALRAVRVVAQFVELDVVFRTPGVRSNAAVFRRANIQTAMQLSLLCLLRLLLH